MLKELGFFRWVLLLATVVSLGALMASYVAPMLDPAKYWMVALFGLAHFWLLVLNILLALLWLISRWKIGVACFVVLLAGITVHAKVVGLGASSAKVPENAFRLMSYNVQLFKLYNWTKNKELRNDMLDFIAKEKADVLCLQEYFYAPGEFFNTTDTLLRLQKAKYCHFEAGVTHNNDHQFGLATFSRFPIVKKGMIRFRDTGSRSNLCIYSDIALPGDTIRIYNVHFASNHLDTKEVDNILEGSERSWVVTRNWLRKLRNGYRLRSEQVRNVTAHARKSPHPVVICGDFNDVPVSYTYRKVNSFLQDAFIGSGRGLGATYNGRLPDLRIDYIFHSPELVSAGFRVHRQPFTDHFPITCFIAPQK